MRADLSVINQEMLNGSIGGISPGGRRASRVRPPVFIVVMGVSGSGKSTLGATLASTITFSRSRSRSGTRSEGAGDGDGDGVEEEDDEVPFIDGDDLHPVSNVAKMSVGQPLTDQDRAPWLRRIRNVVEGVLGVGVGVDGRKSGDELDGKDEDVGAGGGASSGEERDVAGSENVNVKGTDGQGEGEDPDSALTPPPASRSHDRREDVVVGHEDTSPPRERPEFQGPEGRLHPEGAEIAATKGTAKLSTSMRRRAAVVVGCSALKRSYRDILRGLSPPSSLPPSGTSCHAYENGNGNKNYDHGQRNGHLSPPPDSASSSSALRILSDANAAATGLDTFRPSPHEQTSQPAIETYFVYIHGTRPALLERMTTRQGHFMKASMLDSQLATLEAPDSSYRRVDHRSARTEERGQFGGGGGRGNTDGEDGEDGEDGDGEEGGWERESNVITVDLMMSTAEQVALARKGLPAWLFDAECDSDVLGDKDGA